MIRNGDGGDVVVVPDVDEGIVEIAAVAVVVVVAVAVVVVVVVVVVVGVVWLTK